MNTVSLKTRAGGVCILDNKILLIHRINLDKEKDSQEYYVLPGGSVESGETVEEAVAREMKEETDIIVEVKEVFLEMEEEVLDKGFKKHCYYICGYISGEANLREDSEEAKEMKEGIHFYKPVWIDLKDLRGLTIFPVEVMNKLVAIFG
jgi:mutator protein MutT